VIYTTNAIESLNMSLSKVTKARGSFPNDEAVSKLLYLVLRNIAKKWTMPSKQKFGTFFPHSHVNPAYVIH